MPSKLFAVLALSAILLIAASVAAAQDIVHVPYPPQTVEKSNDAQPGTHWCATLDMARSPEGQEALRNFSEALLNGTLPRVSKSQERQKVGVLQTFNIQPQSATDWSSAEFELRATGTRFNIWVRSDSPTQPAISDERIEALRQALESATPPRSFHANMGVFALDELVFGQAPVYPVGSDGVVDILIYEVFPGAAGFVSATDLNPNAKEGEGNQGEVLHIDVSTFQRTDDGQAESVIAHEYHHLIHFNYDPTKREVDFVNEGLSEYAQLMVGYQASIPLHLLVSPPEYNIDLFSWRRGDNGIASGLDYTRASTWHGYLGDQLGPELTGAITRNPQIGLEGYKAVLAEAGSDKTIDELILDYHTAMIVDDLSIDPRFGVKDPVRASQLDIVLPFNRRFDGTRRTNANINDLEIKAGGTEYFEWTNVTDLQLAFDAISGPEFIEARRQHARLRVVAWPVSGPVQAFEYTPSDETHLIEGTFKKVILIAADVRPDVVPLPAYMHSSWSESELQIVSYAYGDDIPYIDSQKGPLVFAMGAEADGAIAVRFPVPPGGQLNDADLGIFHLSEFGVGPLEAPRDYLLTVWDNGGGVPGDIIYSELYVNPNPAILISIAAYHWQSFEFSPRLGKNVALPDTIYIGAREVGIDDNYMVVWPARVNPQGFPNLIPVDTGYLGGKDDNGNRFWSKSWETTFVGGDEGDLPLRSTALPVRARFVIDPTTIAVEDEPELPVSVDLRQNYPNPFNPTTSITFSMPEPADVLLKVFDLTGREVATLVDGQRPAGTYHVTVDGSGWASGMYIYRLQTGNQLITRQMVLLK